MIYIVLLSVVFIIYWDLIIFRLREEELFQDVFKVPPNILITISLIILAVVIFSEKRWDILPHFLISFVLPLYLLRRWRFLSRVDAGHNDFDQEKNVEQPHLKRLSNHVNLEISPVENKGFTASKLGEKSILGQSPKWRQKSSLVLLSDAIGVIIIWFFCSVIMAYCIKMFNQLNLWQSSELGKLVITGVISFIVIVVLIRHAAGKISEGDFFENVGFLKGKNSPKKTYFVPALMGIGFASVSASIILNRSDHPITPLSEIVNTSASPVALLGFIALAILVAPLIEEIIFRGYYFHVLKTIWSERLAIVVISLIFSFLHVGQYWGDWIAIGMVTLLGFCLTYLRAWAGTTMASVIMHYVYNGGVTIIPIIIIMSSHPAYFQYKLKSAELKFSQKEALLTESISKKPDFVDAYYDLALIYLEENVNLEKALELINTAIESDEENVKMLEVKIEILESLNKEDEAEDIRALMNQ